MKQKRILVCPMDWGLGHATRCIPVIRKLLASGCEVGIASSGGSLELLREEFPSLVMYSIRGYSPYYSRSSSQVPAMALQLPKFYRTVRQENREIESIIERDHWDVIISDNRYGCRSQKVPSIFITHQLNIQAPLFVSGFMNGINHRIIKKFSACWVPDFPGEESMAGDLSAQNGFPVSYVGMLSRFTKSVQEKKYDVIALVSGPEPQRQTWENILRRELKKINVRALLVRGVPGPTVRKSEGMLEEVNHLNSAELNKAILQSEVVVSRPGYSTIMDLATLEKKAVFVPTPGQTEQEYLGRELMKKKIALCVDQNCLDLSSALERVKEFRGFSGYKNDQLLSETLDKLIS